MKRIIGIFVALTFFSVLFSGHFRPLFAAENGANTEKGVEQGTREVLEKVQKLFDEKRYVKGANVLLEQAEKVQNPREANELRFMALRGLVFDFRETGENGQRVRKLAEDILAQTSGEDEENAYILAGHVYKMIGDYEAAREVLEAFMKEYPALSEEEIEEYKEQNKATDGRGDMPPRTMRRKMAEQLLKNVQRLGKEAPSFSLQTLTGEKVTLDSYKGKILLLDFWATWCGPCLKELPHVKELYSQYHDKGLEILGLSLDRDRETLEDFVEEKDISWSQVYLREKNQLGVAREYGVTGIPAMFLIDRDGRLVDSGLRGEALKRAIESLLSQQQ